DDAIAALQAAVARAQGDSPDRAPAEAVARVHAQLADAFMARGNLGSASENYKAALRLAPDLTACWCNLGHVHLESGRAQDAITLYRQALQLNPAHWPSRTNLVQALMATGQQAIAKALLRELIGERPNDARLHHELGKACFALKAPIEAMLHFAQAVALDP